MAGDVSEVVDQETERLIEILVTIALRQSMFDMLGENPKNDASSGVNYCQAKLRIINRTTRDRGSVAPPNIFPNKGIGKAYFENQVRFRGAAYQFIASPALQRGVELIVKAAGLSGVPAVGVSTCIGNKHFLSTGDLRGERSREDGFCLLSTSVACQRARRNGSKQDGEPWDFPHFVAPFSWVEKQIDLRVNLLDGENFGHVSGLRR